MGKMEILSELYSLRAGLSLISLDKNKVDELNSVIVKNKETIANIDRKISAIQASIDSLKNKIKEEEDINVDKLVIPNIKKLAELKEKITYLKNKYKTTASRPFRKLIKTLIITAIIGCVIGAVLW